MALPNGWTADDVRRLHYYSKQKDFVVKCEGDEVDIYVPDENKLHLWEKQNEDDFDYFPSFSFVDCRYGTCYVFEDQNKSDFTVEKVTKQKVDW
jgi:hypothetical protein